MTPEEIEVEIKALVEKAVEDEYVRLRQDIVESLSEVVGPGKISPEQAAPLLGVSFTTVYRYLSSRTSKLYLPPIDQVPVIAAFIGRIAEIRETWKDILTGWRPDSNDDVKRVFFHPGLIAIIESDRPIEEKLDQLTKRTIGLISRALEEGE